jgi:hypothetical protein
VSTRKSVPFPDIQFTKDDPAVQQVAKLNRLKDVVRALLSEVQQVQAFLRSGDEGAVLVKQSPSDYDIIWSSAPSSLTGTIWRVGNGVPSNTLGKNGDFYLDASTDNVYEKVGGTYLLVANFKGQKGNPGNPGNPGTPGRDGINGLTIPGRRGEDGEPGRAGAIITMPGGAAQPIYLVQLVASVHYTVDQFVRGITIIGVRVAGPSNVYLPHGLPIDEIIMIKDETGAGSITVSVY